ncbi:MAG: hypothetical protein DRI95_00670 [Bacteroidetes bacterium]|nr:MAG: hypothetical protein DRI95_00670 [Bacteroidota bacterium]
MNYEIIIKDIPKLSFNVYNSAHWSKKTRFKHTLQVLLLSASRLKLEGGYSLKFDFYFKGRKMDSVNTFHYCKIFEDVIFKEDKENRQICTETHKDSKENKVIIKIIDK